jgi:arylsulfatase A-like enzyme
MSLFDPHDPYEDHPLSARTMIDAARIPPPVAAKALPGAARREQQNSYLGPATDFSPDDIHEMRLGYGASIAFADQQIGRVLAALEESGLAGNTVVIFASDHGDQLGDHGLFVKGVALYEPTVGVPLLLRWPGRVAAGLRTGALAQGRDIAATCLAAAGLDPALPQSEDLVEMARNGRSRRKAAVCAYRNSGIDGSGRFWSPPLTSTMVRSERHKLIASAGGGPTDFELFDLADDPAESRNLFGKPEVAQIQLELLTELSGFLQQEAASARPRVPPSIPSGAQLMRNRLKP